MTLKILDTLLSHSVKTLIGIVGLPQLAVALGWVDHLGKLLQELNPRWISALLLLTTSISISLAAFIYLKRQKFVEYRGAFFKPLKDGKFHEAVYCGICKSPTSTGDGIPATYAQFKCKCGWNSLFTYGEFHKFIHAKDGTFP